MYGRSVSYSVPFRYDVETVEAAASVGNAGDQREQILAFGDVAGCRFIAFIDLFVDDPVTQGIPIVFNDDLVADIQIWDVVEKYPPDVSRMT